MLVARHSLMLASTLALSGSLMGCTNTIVSDPVSEAAATGLAYGLPRGMVRIKAQRKQISAKDATKLKAAADDAQTKANEWSVKLNEALDAQEIAAANAKQDSTMKDEFARALAAADTVLKSTQDFSTAAAEDAKRAKAAADAAVVGDYEDTVTITELPYYADPDARYVANLNHWISRDDEMKITVKDGLLTSGNSISTDRTKDIILELVKGVTAFVRPPTQFRTSAATGVKSQPKPACNEFLIALDFDPTDSTPPLSGSNLPPDGRRSARWASKVLFDNSNGAIRLDVGPSTSQRPAGPGTTTTLGQAPSTGTTSQGKGTGLPGLAYRVLSPYWINVVISDGAGCSLGSPPQLQVTTFHLPDPSQTFVLPSEAGAFTKSVSTHGFKNGIPTDFSTNRPSELLAIASLPLDIARAIISVPTDLIKLKVDYNNEAEALVKARAGIADNQLKLLRSQYDLDKAIRDQEAAFGTKAD